MGDAAVQQRGSTGAVEGHTAPLKAITKRFHSGAVLKAHSRLRKASFWFSIARILFLSRSRLVAIDVLHMDTTLTEQALGTVDVLPPAHCKVKLRFRDYDLDYPCLNNRTSAVHAREMSDDEG